MCVRGGEPPSCFGYRINDSILVTGSRRTQALDPEESQGVGRADP